MNTQITEPGWNWIIAFAYAMETIAVVLPAGGLCLLALVVIIPGLADQPLRRPRRSPAEAEVTPASISPSSRGLSGSDGLSMERAKSRAGVLCLPSVWTLSPDQWD